MDSNTFNKIALVQADTLISRQAKEISNLKAILHDFITLHECREDLTRDDYHYIYTLAKDLLEK